MTVRTVRSDSSLGPGPAGWAGFLDAVAVQLKSADDGPELHITRPGAGAAELRMIAVGSAAPAEYRLAFDAGRAWVGLFTADRYLSQSIEQDLVHTGDKPTELLEEELVDLGIQSKGVPTAWPVEHFRNDEKLFTFRSPLPITEFGSSHAAAVATIAMLAYEACFRRLGDMDSKED